MATGRPTKYTKALGDRIADLVTEGYSLRTIAKRKGMPGLRTMVRWYADEEHPFRPQILRARELKLDMIELDLEEMADGLHRTAKERLDSGAVARDRLSTKVRMEVLERRRKATWAKRTDIDLGVPAGGMPNGGTFKLEIVHGRAPGAEEDSKGDGRNVA